MTRSKSQLSAGAVLEALRKGPMSEPAHSWLYEVRNQTGYRDEQRYADALVISAWPSRGIWFAGVEAKVSRSDWRAELAAPEKSEAIQRFCNYWWIAAPEGVVLPEEVPATWGHYVVAGGKAFIAKPAPELKPQPLEPSFVASVLRNAARAQERVRKAAHAEGYTAARAECDESAITGLRVKLVHAQTELQAAARERDEARRDAALLRADRVAFEHEAGLTEGALSVRGYQRNIGAQFRAAGVLAQMPPEQLAKAFAGAAEALRAVADATAVLKAVGS